MVTQAGDSGLGKVITARYIWELISQSNAGLNQAIFQPVNPRAARARAKIDDVAQTGSGQQIRNACSDDAVRIEEVGRELKKIRQSVTDRSGAKHRIVYLE